MVMYDHNCILIVVSFLDNNAGLINFNFLEVGMGKTKHFVPFCYTSCPKQDSPLIPYLEYLLLLTFNVVSIMPEPESWAAVSSRDGVGAGHNMEQF